MKKKIIVLSFFLSSLMSITSFADGWERTNGNWMYYQNNQYAKNGWIWIDGNNDGISEAYCFDDGGNLYTNTITPDGANVNIAGEWNINDVVIFKENGLSLPGTAATFSSKNENTNGSKYIEINRKEIRWFYEGTEWCVYHEKDGISEKLKNQWVIDNGRYFYLNENGNMLANTTTPDGYVVGSDGAWIQ